MFRKPGSDKFNCVICGVEATYSILAVTEDVSRE